MKLSMVAASGFIIGLNLLAFQNFTTSNLTSDQFLGSKTCTIAKINELVAKASVTSRRVYLNCSVQLSVNQVITKQVIIRGHEGSGVTLDLNGATVDTGGDEDVIRVESQKSLNANGEEVWNRPENVQILNGNVIGSMRFAGLGVSELYALSRLPGLTKKAQDAAPKNILVKNMHIQTRGRIPIYALPGVTHFRLEDSVISGNSGSTAIYLDAESGHHVIKNNIFKTTHAREAIAIDGSAYNKILDNTFEHVGQGGIFIYRNCGERGVSRHQPPHHNSIVNNFFGTAGAPNVFIGSRQGNRSYCGADSDSKYGSGIDNRDFARHNAIIQNQLSGPLSLIVDNDSYNVVRDNERVSGLVDRKAGCWIANAYPEARFLLDGNSVQLFNKDGGPYCNGHKYTCQDGELISSTIQCPILETKTQSFSCSKESSNEGCSKKIQLQCPSGMKLVGLRAACNLESTKMTSAVPEQLSWNILRVSRQSDYVSEGSCQIGDFKISSGEVKVTLPKLGTDLTVSCHEHDKNGGDCIIRGQWLCSTSHEIYQD